MPKIISHTPKKRNLITFDPGNISFALTCQSGLESLVRRDAEKRGIKESSGQDRLVFGKGNLETLYQLLVGSRFANRVYIDIHSKKILDFDTLHDTLVDIEWSDYLTGKELIIIEAASTRSALSSTPTIQSVAQKAIFSTLRTPNNAHAVEVHILVLIIDDIAHILLDVTGDPLHKRGYREEAGEAPIKENLAAALVAFANWKYKTPLLDPFCGSGTIAIEAAMMARNIAPGVNRRFRIESLPFHNREELISVKNIARLNAYPSGEYKIFASDIDRNMVDIAMRNAERAGVSEDIIFSVSDYMSTDPSPSNHLTIQPSDQLTIVTNPPYGKRLESENIEEIHTKLLHDIQSHTGGCITTYPVDIRYGLANKKLLNGSEECRFWYKK